MKLFYLPGACSLAPHILLNELKIPYELEKMNKADKTSILKHNPKGSVPTLVFDNGKVLTEVAVILQYLADLKPESQLIPTTGTWERYKCQEWLNYVSSEVHKSLGVMFNPGFDENAKNVLRTNAEKKFEFLNNHFSKNDYLMGKDFTVPDIYAFVVLNWSKAVGIDVSKYPNVGKFLERIGSRPSVAESKSKES